MAEGTHGDAASGADSKDDNDPAEAIRAIIRATVSAAGEPDPETLPHLVRQRLEGQVGSDVDVDAYVEEVMAELRKAK